MYWDPVQLWSNHFASSSVMRAVIGPVGTAEKLYITWLAIMLPAGRSLLGAVHASRFNPANLQNTWTPYMSQMECQPCKWYRENQIIMGDGRLLLFCHIYDMGLFQNIATASVFLLVCACVSSGFYLWQMFTAPATFFALMLPPASSAHLAVMHGWRYRII